MRRRSLTLGARGRCSRFGSARDSGLGGRALDACKTLDLGGAFDESVFIQGLAQSQQPGSLLHKLFAVRTLGLFERLSAAQLPSYLSGLLIGEELRSQADTGPVIVVGNEALTLRYTLALQHLGIPSQSRGSEATWAGLHTLASHLTNPA